MWKKSNFSGLKTWCVPSLLDYIIHHLSKAVTSCMSAFWAGSFTHRCSLFMCVCSPVNLFHTLHGVSSSGLPLRAGTTLPASMKDKHRQIHANQLPALSSTTLLVQVFFLEYLRQKLILLPGSSLDNWPFHRNGEGLLFSFFHPQPSHTIILRAIMTSYFSPSIGSTHTHLHTYGNILLPKKKSDK